MHYQGLVGTCEMGGKVSVETLTLLLSCGSQAPSTAWSSLEAQRTSGTHSRLWVISHLWSAPVPSSLPLTTVVHNLRCLTLVSQWVNSGMWPTSGPHQPLRLSHMYWPAYLDLAGWCSNNATPVYKTQRWWVPHIPLMATWCIPHHLSTSGLSPSPLKAFWGPNTHKSFINGLSCL